MPNGDRAFDLEWDVQTSGCTNHPPHCRIFGSRFVDEVEKADRGVRLKSRLISQSYNDKGPAMIATKAPQSQRYVQRLAMCLASSMVNMTVYTRDVTQAYVQPTTRLERDVYLRPPPVMGLPVNIILQIMKPLYGIPESGLY